MTIGGSTCSIRTTPSKAIIAPSAAAMGRFGDVQVRAGDHSVRRSGSDSLRRGRAPDPDLSCLVAAQWDGAGWTRRTTVYGDGMRKIAYLAVAMATALFGYLALFSIGFPFLLTGLLMLTLTPLRRRIEIMVPALLWPWMFTLGYVLVAPLGCTRFATPTIVDGVGNLEGTTRCNALFFTYAGDGSYSPPIWPAVLVGALFATGILVLVQRTMTRRRMLAAAR